MVFITMGMSAQKNSTSAYSFFGLGNGNVKRTAEQLSMGGVGVAMKEDYRLNFSNPAAYSSLSFTTFAMALENKNMVVDDGTDSEAAAATSLSYFALGIPLGPKGGFAFGLLPNTTVGYSLRSDIFEDSGDLYEATLYNGSGGVNNLFFGAGYEIFKGFSIGAQGNYFFGNIENSILNQVKDVSLATKYETFVDIEGFSGNVGFQYERPVSEKLYMTVGGNFEIENTTSTKETEYLYSLALGNFDIPKDTILNVSSRGKVIAPLKSALGLGVGEKNKWFAQAEYVFQKPYGYDGSVYGKNSDVKYGDYSKFAIGGHYTPKINSITSYWDRVTYRFGVKKEYSGLLLDISGNESDYTEIEDFGISFGVGLPVGSGSQLSSFNLGFEFGKRGEDTKGLVQENYFNLRLSLSLTDKWFRKVEIF